MTSFSQGWPAGIKTWVSICTETDAPAQGREEHNETGWDPSSWWGKEAVTTPGKKKKGKLNQGRHNPPDKRGIQQESRAQIECKPKTVVLQAVLISWYSTAEQRGKLHCPAQEGAPHTASPWQCDILPEGAIQLIIRKCDWEPHLGIFPHLSN